MSTENGITSSLVTCLNVRERIKRANQSQTLKFYSWKPQHLRALQNPCIHAMHLESHGVSTSLTNYPLAKRTHQSCCSWCASPPATALWTPCQIGLHGCGKESSASPLLESYMIWPCPFPTTVLWESRMLFLPSLFIRKEHVFIFSTTTHGVIFVSFCARSFISVTQTIVKETKQI